MKLKAVENHFHTGHKSSAAKIYYKFHPYFWDRRQESEDQKVCAIQMAVEKGHYEADRIQRQYDASDPANRLVSGELERRWNEALQKVAALEAKLDFMRQSVKVLSQEDRTLLLRMGEDLDLIWNHPNVQFISRSESCVP